MYKHWLLFKYANFATIKIHAVHYVSTDPDNNSKAEKNTTPTGIQLHLENSGVWSKSGDERLRQAGGIFWLPDMCMWIEGNLKSILAFQVRWGLDQPCTLFQHLSFVLRQESEVADSQQLYKLDVHAKRKINFIISINTCLQVCKWVLAGLSSLNHWNRTRHMIVYKKVILSWQMSEQLQTMCLN